MMVANKPELTIGYVGPDDNITKKILSGLKQSSVVIKHQLSPNQIMEQSASLHDIDIWLISISDDDWNESVEYLLNHSDIAVYFNEHNASNDWTQWNKRLIRKLKQLVEEERREQQSSFSFEPNPTLLQSSPAIFSDETFVSFQKKENMLSEIISEEVSNLEDTLYVLDEKRDLKDPAFTEELLTDASAQYPLLNMGMELWILGSSFGGPEALKAFFHALPKHNYPVAFFVVQHLGQGHMAALKEMVSPELAELKLHLMQRSQFLESSSVYIVPSDCRLTFVPNGLIAPSKYPWTEPFAPNINDVIEDCLNNYPAHSGGVMIFSGMSNDGSEHLAKVADRGWNIWAQASDTCIQDSMPNAARDTGFVQFSASPEELAKSFYQHIQNKYAGHF